MASNRNAAGLGDKKAAKPDDKTAKPKKDKLQAEIINAQREHLRENDKTIHSLKKEVAVLENGFARVSRRVTAAEDEAEALLSAVRVLAEEIPRNTTDGKKVRATARKLLEKQKIRPPHTHGSSRNKKAKKRRRKKKA